MKLIVIKLCGRGTYIWERRTKDEEEKKIEDEEEE